MRSNLMQSGLEKSAHCSLLYALGLSPRALFFARINPVLVPTYRA